MKKSTLAKYVVTLAGIGMLCLSITMVAAQPKDGGAKDGGTKDATSPPVQQPETGKQPDTGKQPESGKQADPVSQFKDKVNQAVGGKDESQAGGKEEKLTEEIVSTVERLNFSKLIEQNSVARWAALGIAILAGLVLGRLAAFALRRFSKRLKEKHWDVIAHVVADFASPASLVLLAVGLWVGLVQLKMEEPLRDFTNDLLLLLNSVAIVWLIFNFVGVVDVAMRRRSADREAQVDRTVIDLIRKTGRLFVIVVAILFIAENVLGANITSWLAGLGIIGLAVSLAAQDSLKNVFGSLTIYLDKPFGIGELVEYTGVMGVVEHIGFRSTTIRSLEGPLLNVPNSKIVSDPVENVSRRTFIRRKLEISLTYSTTAKQMQQAMDIVLEIMQLDGIADAIQREDQADAQPGKPRVYFSDFNADHLNLVVYYWHEPGDWWKYQEHTTLFNMELLRRFNEAGLEFAFPTQTIHLDQAAGKARVSSDAQADTNTDNNTNTEDESGQPDEPDQQEEHQEEEQEESPKDASKRDNKPRTQAGTHKSHAPPHPGEDPDNDDDGGQGDDGGDGGDR